MKGSGRKKSQKEEGKKGERKIMCKIQWKTAWRKNTAQGRKYIQAKA